MKGKQDGTESIEIIERMEFVIDKLEREELISILRNRFMENSQRHKDIAWSEIENRLNQNEDNIRVLSNMEITGGSLFGDKRYDTVFIYHNGAESYYASRGFRGLYLV